MQVEAMKQSWSQERLNSALDVEVKTVDGFQGNERDVIIFSVVRANQNKQIGFLNDSRRLNVAITCGRYWQGCLIGRPEAFYWMKWTDGRTDGPGHYADSVPDGALFIGVCRLPERWRA